MGNLTSVHDLAAGCVFFPPECLWPSGSVAVCIVKAFSRLMRAITGTSVFVLSPRVDPRVNAKPRHAGGPNRRTKITSKDPLTWPGSRSGGAKTQVTRRDLARSLPERYKISPFRNPLSHNLLPVIFSRGRYKISPVCKPLCGWDLSLKPWGQRCKRTSSATSADS